MSKGWKIYNILLWTSSTLIAVWIPNSSLLQNKESLVYKYLFANPFPILCLMAVCVISSIWKKISEENTHKANLQDFLEFIHGNIFPHDSGGRDPNYRITLFVPGKNLWLQKKLKFYARSGKPPKSKIKWSINKSEYARSDDEHDGVVGYAWAKEIFIEIDDLPDYDKSLPIDKNKYIKKTFLDSKRIKKLSWLSRSYRCLVIRNKDGQKVGALMVESKNPVGLKRIKSKNLKYAAGALQCFF